MPELEAAFAGLHPGQMLLANLIVLAATGYLLGVIHGMSSPSAGYKTLVVWP